jgi:hypothetical protein
MGILTGSTSRVRLPVFHNNSVPHKVHTGYGGLISLLTNGYRTIVHVGKAA